MAIAETYKDAAPGKTLPEVVETAAPLKLALFAGGSGDHNPIHLDRDFAQASGFPDVFAHGMLSMAFLGRMLSNWAPPERIAHYSARFLAITPLRSEVRCLGEIVAVEERGGARFAALKLSTSLPDGTATLAGEASIRLD